MDFSSASWKRKNATANPWRVGLQGVVEVPYRADSALLGLINKTCKRVTRSNHVETIEPLETEALGFPLHLGS
jgi:hypothetical protein